MTRTELLEHYLKPTNLTVKELIDRNAFAQIMQFTEAYHLEQLRIGGVGSSLPKVCKGCGSLSTKVIDKKYLACCPDNNYIPMEDFCKKAIYPETQF